MRNRPILYTGVCLAAAFFLLAFPIYVIRPFRYQGPHELEAALNILNYRPALELICAVCSLVILLQTWNYVSKFRRVALALLTVFVLACAVLSRVNVYEKMFHPLDKPTFSAASQSKLNPAEQVIAVRISNAARAYPIRAMSYHHIVNDTLAGRAIVATY